MFIKHTDSRRNKYEQFALCNGEEMVWHPDSECVPCEDCARISKERAAKRAAAAQAQIDAQKAKMDQFGDPQIFD